MYYAPRIHGTRCSVKQNSVVSLFSVMLDDQRTLERQHERRNVGDFCIVRAAPEGVAHPQRLADRRDRVVEPLQPGLSTQKIRVSEGIKI